MKLTDEQLLIFLFNDIADFLEELTWGNLDSRNIMAKARQLQKVIEGE